ncbi:MAG: hypothetical protein PQJ44_07090 [Sphaerochaetaceae bacterium]|nr:hypothetical protein [Sphaerochaetaceae bacterium]
MNQDMIDFIKNYVATRAEKHFSDDFPIDEISVWIQKASEEWFKMKENENALDND